MAKKNNLVGGAKAKISLILIAGMAAGWGISGYTVVLQNSVRKQNAMVEKAEEFIPDKLYIRAANQYKEALKAYSTKNNLTYERRLLDIYAEGGMTEEYADLVDDRIEAKTALVDEYLSRAETLIEEESIKRAIRYLQQGIEIYGDSQLVDLCESVKYQYNTNGTDYQEGKLPSENWIIPMWNGEKWGYTGKNGRTNIEFEYDDATRFSGDYAVVKIDGVYTLIDQNGYWNAVDKNGLDQVIDIAGDKIIGVKDGKYGIYSNMFERLNEEDYEDAHLNDNGMVVVKKDGKWAVLDGNMKNVTDFELTDVAVNSRGQVFSGKYAVVADGNGYFLIDQKGKACYEKRFPNAKGYEGGYYAVSDSDGNWGFADEAGENVIPCQYVDAYSFSNQTAAVQYAGKWGYIKQYGNMVINAEYSEALPFLNGKAFAYDDQGNIEVLELKYFELF
ncbi:WG repeat-containing protein [Clostridium sp. AF02-29]|uniref:WG repeat-containing protein n=1 Tax=Clostridium sp. AF02-29 TaxID=2292993 RepID=UPI002353CA11|nr:WG repeat-containing protein [Clostridium sp. AF02-29]